MNLLTLLMQDVWATNKKRHRRKFRSISTYTTQDISVDTARDSKPRRFYFLFPLAMARNHGHSVIQTLPGQVWLPLNHESLALANLDS